MALLVKIAFVAFLVSLVPVTSAHAECVRISPKMAADGAYGELLFSGKVVEIARTSDLGYRATFDVDHVWRGSVSKRFALYVWDLAAETPSFEAGREYVAVAKRLADAMREKVGVSSTDVTAYTPVTCSGGYSVSEFLRELGPGKPPQESKGARKP